MQPSFPLSLFKASSSNNNHSSPPPPTDGQNSLSVCLSAEMKLSSSVQSGSVAAQLPAQMLAFKRILSEDLSDRL